VCKSSIKAKQSSESKTVPQWSGVLVVRVEEEVGERLFLLFLRILIFSFVRFLLFLTLSLLFFLLLLFLLCFLLLRLLSKLLEALWRLFVLRKVEGGSPVELSSLQVVGRESGPGALP
jgi:hypothetical protein